MSNVLIVDDSALDREMIVRALEPSGYDLTFADGGEQALRVAHEKTPDLILTDVVMDGMDGVELVKRLRADFPQAPVILVTTAGSEKVAAKALYAGAASYVPKASLSFDLAPVVKHMLGLVSTERAKRRLLSRLRESQFVFEIGNDASQINSLITFLQDSAAEMGVFDENELMHVGVALDEALTNAFYHGNLEVDSSLREREGDDYYELAESRMRTAPYKDRQVYVSAHICAGRARFVIRDEGPGFDVSKLPDPADAENLDKASGRGITLMRFFMDRVEYNDRGNELTLEKRSRMAQEA